GSCVSGNRPAPACNPVVRFRPNSARLAMWTGSGSAGRRRERSATTRPSAYQRVNESIGRILSTGYRDAATRAGSLIGGCLQALASGHGNGTIRARGAISGTRAEPQDRLVGFLVR